VAIDTLSHRALLEAKETHSYAPRQKVWPPKGYVAPTAEEFADLLRAAHGYATGLVYRSVWERLSDEQVLRRTQLIEVIGALPPREECEVYDYLRALRNELRRRKVTFRSIAVLRCESCNHASERLFEATQETHPGLAKRDGEKISSAFYCARCWSGEDVADDETEDEE
jgi:hypothetical protein